MAENTGFLNTIIGAVRNFKLAAIDTFGGLDSFALETPFMDDESIMSMIDTLKAEYKGNAEELTQLKRFENGDEYREQMNELYARQVSIRADLAYLFAHNPSKIDECLGLLENTKNEFTICLNAMKLFTQGNYDHSYEVFTNYIRAIDSIPEHFQTCRMFGELLLKRQQFKHAIAFLRKASEKRPDDVGVHNMLAECYRAESMDFELGVESTITELLTCQNLGSLENSGEYRIPSGKDWE